MLKTVSSITNAIGALNYKGTWDAATNTPTITSSVGTKGDYYVVSVDGSTLINGISNWGVGDWIVFNGAVWQRLEGGADLNAVDLSVSGTTTLSGLTASTAVALNANKQLISVTNTGTNNNVLSTSPSITTPRVITSIDDTNGNELIGVTATASAVNEITVANAATGDSPVISTSGSDTNINLTITPKGTGRTIISTGAVGIGTLSVSGKCNILANAQNGSGYNLFLRNTWTGDVGVPGLYIAKRDNNSTTSQILVRFSINDDNNGQGQINGNGAGAAAFGSFSDRRLKENIADLPAQLDNICALRPVEFDYIESAGGGHQIGFIAQELQAIYPDAVGERDPDEMLTVTGWSKTEARLVKAIQELKAELNMLKAEITALKA